MAGHNKWSKVKNKKAVTDARKSRIYTKLLRELTVAAKTAGPDSAKVQLVVAKCRAANMSGELVNRAINKSREAGEGEGYEDVTYEGYGPGGVAIVVDALTDNRHRTVADLRHLMSKHGGTMGTSGSVLWQFKTVGQLAFEARPGSEDALLEVMMEAGADDIDTSDEETWFVTCDPALLAAVRDAAEAAGWEAKQVELARVASNLVAVDDESARKVVRMMDALEDHDDVKAVYANLDLPDDLDHHA